MKIKKLSKSKHIDSRNNIIVEIFAKCTYKVVLFSSTSTKINTSKIFAVFAYKMTLFFNELQKLKTFNFEIIESAYDFDFRVCETIIWYHAIATRIKFYFYDIFDIFRYLFYEFHCFTHKTWSVWLNLQCQNCYVYENLCCMFRDDLLIVVENDNLLWKKTVEEKKCEIARATKH